MSAAPRNAHRTLLLPVPETAAGCQPAPEKFLRQCSSSFSGMMENRNTHLAPGFTLNDLVPAPANTAAFPGLPGPTHCPSGSGTASPRVAREPPGPHSAPGDSPFPPEHRQVGSCGAAAFALPLFTVLMEFKPSPFSLLLSPVLVQSLRLFPLFHFLSSCFWGECFSRILLRPPSLCPLSAHRSTSLPAPSRSPSSALRAAYLLNSVVQFVRIVVLILRSVF